MIPFACTQAPLIGIRATENIDGDYITGDTHFTGGNHAYTNSAKGEATAALKHIEFFADDQPITQGEGYCNNLKIHWVNSVAATNTKRVDGSGRYVLEENHIAVFDGSEWTETVTLTALESVLIDFIYGFQAEIRGVWDSYVTFSRDDGYNNIFDGSKSAFSGFIDVTSIICSKGTNYLSITLDKDFGIGHRNFFNNPNGAFMANYGKVYMNIVNGVSINANAGEDYSYRGKYKFYSLE